MRTWRTLLIATAERYEHNAIFLHRIRVIWMRVLRLIDLVREKAESHFLMITGMLHSASRAKCACVRIRGDLKDSSVRRRRMWIGHWLCRGGKPQPGGLDGFKRRRRSRSASTGAGLGLPIQRVPSPYLARLTRGYQDQGLVIKHTDSSIMPISGPDCGAVRRRPPIAWMVPHARSATTAVPAC